MKLKDINDSILQRYAEKLVEREVYHCASNMMYELARTEGLPFDSCSWLELHSELYEKRYSVITAEYEHETEDEILYHTEYFEEYEEDDVPETMEKDGKTYTLASTEEDEENYHEVFEHWIISSWLGKKLTQYDEIVGEVFDFTIWGRCTTGQAICLDRCFQEIAFELWSDEMIKEQEELNREVAA